MDIYFALILLSLLNVSSCFFIIWKWFAYPVFTISYSLERLLLILTLTSSGMHNLIFLNFNNTEFSVFVTLIISSGKIHQMLKSVFIQNISWNTLDDLLPINSKLKILLRICLMIILMMTVMHTLITITQEETRDMLMLGHSTSILTPTVSPLLYLLRWFSKSGQYRRKKMKEAKNIVDKLAKCYVVLLIMLLDMFGVFMIVTSNLGHSVSDGDKMFWIMFSISCVVNVIISLYPIITEIIIQKI